MAKLHHLNTLQAAEDKFGMDVHTAHRLLDEIGYRKTWDHDDLMQAMRKISDMGWPRYADAWNLIEAVAELDRIRVKHEQSVRAYHRQQRKQARDARLIR